MEIRLICERRFAILVNNRRILSDYTGLWLLTPTSSYSVLLDFKLESGLLQIVS